MQTAKRTNTQLNQLQTQKAENFLVIENVSKIYPTAEGPYTVLDGVDLKVREGEFVCIIGHSGCGKSTLLNMISGFNTPTDGVVLLQDQPITEPGWRNEAASCDRPRPLHPSASSDS